VNSDESVRSYKDPRRPINPEAERMYVIAGLESVDAVTRMDDDRPLKLIERWKPDLYIKGGDYGSASLRSGPAVEAYGGRTVVIPPKFSLSTTAIFERIQALAVHAAPEKAPEREIRGLVLLDRDGTLVQDACFDPSRVELLPGVAEALQMLQSAGFRLCILTNQQGIGLGYFGYQDFIDGNRRLLRALGESGVVIARIYFCPHSAADGCVCRKPAPGMIVRALRDENMPAERCFVIGDSAQDLEAAQAAGCAGFLVGPGHLEIVEAARRILKS
jgi:D-glycero-D-manno-heptose 1,7-bisphosphate phosphatase